MKTELYPTADQPTRFAVFHLELKGSGKSARSTAEKLAEASNLVAALSRVEVVMAQSFNISQVTSATLMGSGKIEEVAAELEANEIEVVMINSQLSPRQQRNLEKAWDVKVIDRSGLILEIFGERAQTKAGRLQVELAQLNYQQGRLVRAWTHLERQRGGTGKTGGPGERQIELDRRMIRDRITAIKRDLEKVEKERNLQRVGRKQAELPTFALVGYTNAGKSTLFNKITNADAMEKDALFATLDPLMRKVKLPSGREVVVADTVGFISDLPHELVNAFHATLEEVALADVLIHVQDGSSPDAAAQRADVLDVIKQIDAANVPMINIINKCDLVTNDDEVKVEGIKLSAITGAGVESLLQAMENSIAVNEHQKTVKISAADGEGLAWLHANAKIIDKQLTDSTWQITVRLNDTNYARFMAKYGE